MTKVQLSLTEQEASLLSQRAISLGYSLARYIKYLISSESLRVFEEYPTYKMSTRAEKVAEKATREYKLGKVKTIDSINELDNL